MAEANNGRRQDRVAVSCRTALGGALTPAGKVRRVTAGIEIVEVDTAAVGSVKIEGGVSLLDECIREVQRIDAAPGGVVEPAGAVTRNWLGDRRGETPQ